MWEEGNGGDMIMYDVATSLLKKKVIQGSFRSLSSIKEKQDVVKRSEWKAGFDSWN